jgi:hypothetical protein
MNPSVICLFQNLFSLLRIGSQRQSSVNMVMKWVFLESEELLHLLSNSQLLWKTVCHEVWSCILLGWWTFKKIYGSLQHYSVMHQCACKAVESGFDLGIPVYEPSTENWRHKTCSDLQPSIHWSSQPLAAGRVHSVWMILNYKVRY